MSRPIIDGWSTAVLGDCLQTIIDYRGKTPPKSPQGIPLISAANIKNGRVQLDDPQFISEEDYRRWTTRGFTQPGDVLITTEAPAGAVAPYPRTGIHLISRRVMALRTDERVLHSGYLSYVLQDRAVQQELAGRNRGTTVPRVLKTDITGLSFALPAMREQRAIAAILGALDDKIDLNRRMNQTLEAMAQAIFKSWFIDFDGQTEFEDSELGPVPVGWSAGSLDDVARRRIESVHPGDLAGDIPYIGLANMPQGSISLQDWGFAKDVTSTKHRFRDHDLLFGKLRPYFKKVGVALCDGICSSDILVIHPRQDHWRSFVLGVLTHDPFIDYTVSMSTGTRMPRVNWKAMSRYPLALPSPPVAKHYDDIVSAQINRLLKNLEESSTLTTLRDTLLPKLISGEIRVPEAEAAVEAVL